RRRSPAAAWPDRAGGGRAAGPTPGSPAPSGRSSPALTRLEQSANRVATSRLQGGRMTSFLGKAGAAMAVGGILRAGAAAGFGVASAVSRPSTSTGFSTSTEDFGASAADPDGAPPWTHHRARDRWRLLGHRIEHGEFTVKGENGKPAVVDVQRGQVTAVSATSITLKSEDGFTASYTVNPDSRIRVGGERKAIGDVRGGNNAGLIAARSGGVATVRLVVVG